MLLLWITEYRFVDDASFFYTKIVKYSLTYFETFIFTPVCRNVEINFLIQVLQKLITFLSNRNQYQNSSAAGLCLKTSKIHTYPAGCQTHVSDFYHSLHKLQTTYECCKKKNVLNRHKTSNAFFHNDKRSFYTPSLSSAFTRLDNISASHDIRLPVWVGYTLPFSLVFSFQTYARHYICFMKYLLNFSYIRRYNINNNTFNKASCLLIY